MLSPSKNHGPTTHIMLDYCPEVTHIVMAQSYDLFPVSKNPQTVHPHPQVGLQTLVSKTIYFCNSKKWGWQRQVSKLSICEQAEPSGRLGFGDPNSATSEKALQPPSCMFPYGFQETCEKKTSVTADRISKHQSSKYMHHLRKTTAISLHLHLVAGDGWVAWQFLHGVQEAVMCWLFYFLTYTALQKMSRYARKRYCL